MNKLSRNDREILAQVHYTGRRPKGIRQTTWNRLRHQSGLPEGTWVERAARALESQGYTFSPSRSQEARRVVYVSWIGGRSWIAELHRNKRIIHFSRSLPSGRVFHRTQRVEEIEVNNEENT